MKLNYPALYQIIVRDDLDEFITYEVDFYSETTNYLMEAVSNNAQKIATFLCTHFNELVNQSDEPYYFDFPLSKAIELNFLEMASILIKHGANCDGHPLSHNTPIRNALHPTSLERLQFLIENGADVNIFPAKHNYTVLDLAYFEQKTQNIDYSVVITYLLNNGAKASREDIHNKSVLMATLKQKLGKVLNFSFSYKQSIIYTGFCENSLNYYFTETDDVVNVIILDADWPVSSNVAYQNTPFACFLDLLDWSSTQIQLEKTVAVENLSEINFPFNCKGFTIEYLNDIVEYHDKEIRLFIPFDVRKKSLKSTSEFPKSLKPISYQYPTDKRGHKIKESKILFQH